MNLKLMWVLTSVYHVNIQNPSNPHWPLSSCSLTCTNRHDACPNWMRHVSHFYMFLKRGSNWNIKMELTVVSYSLNSSHCTASQWTQQIWDPDFSCDSTFAFVVAGADAVLIYRKKIRINWPLPPLADLFHSRQERSIFQIRVNTVIKDTFVSSPFYT